MPLLVVVAVVILATRGHVLIIATKNKPEVVIDITAMETAVVKVEAVNIVVHPAGKRLLRRGELPVEEAMAETEMEECRPEMVAVPEVVQVVTADNPGSARVESVWMISHRPFKP